MDRNLKMIIVITLYVLIIQPKFEGHSISHKSGGDNMDKESFYIVRISQYLLFMVSGCQSLVTLTK